MITLEKLQSSEYAILLIGEELKSRRFFNTLQHLGLDYSYFQPHLDTLILDVLNLDSESDAEFEFYSSLMDQHADRIGISRQSVQAEAKAVLVKLTGRASRQNE